MHEDNPVARPIAGLMSTQPPEVVEYITKEEIRLHRRLLDEAQTLYDEMRRSNEDPAVELAYLSKMIALHSQQTALSALLDILGYIPDVPAEGTH
jgi:TraR antiactivator